MEMIPIINGCKLCPRVTHGPYCGSQGHPIYYYALGFNLDGLCACCPL